MQRRAFTLVEVLVVVGIIAVLVGILLPAMSRARDQARAATCIANLRQLALAAQHYALQHGGRFPVAQWDTDAWDFSRVNNKPVPGLLWRGQSEMRMQQCPSFDGRASSLDPYTGYNYNTSYIGHGQNEAVEAPARLAEVRDPARTALFGDGEYASGANKFMRAPLRRPGDPDQTNPATRAAGTQGFRHRRATNVAFVDGHVEAWRERHTQTDDPNTPIAPGTGFLSRDNSMYDLE